MDRIIEIKPPDHLYSPIIRICYLRSSPYHLQLKGITLQMLPNIQFHGLPSENSNAHLISFIEVYDTVKYNGVTEEALRLRLFPLSLSDRAKHWLTSQPSDSVISWNDFVQKFLTKIFPLTKIAQLVQEINTFRQF